MMIRKKIFTLAVIILTFVFVPESFAAEEKDLATDYVTKVQNEISSDISKLRTLVDKELEGFDLSPEHIAQRLNDIAVLATKASDDMAAWGYTPEQRELHESILSQLNAEYAAYGALLHRNSAAVVDGTTSVDVSELGTVESPDINMSYSLRQEIRKVSRELDVLVFYLQSKLSKLRLDLANASKLGAELKEAEEGTKALELPRTHVLKLEAARLSVALSQIQVQIQKRTFDKSVAELRRLRNRLDSFEGKIIFPEKLLDANVSLIQERIVSLTEEMNSARKSLEAANAALMRAHARLGSADVTAKTPEGANYMARSSRVTYWEYMVSLLGDEIVLADEAQQIWRDRYKLFHGQASGEEIWRMRERSQARIVELQRQLESVRTMESAVLRQIAMLQEQMNSEDIPSANMANLQQALDNYRKVISNIFNRYEALLPNEIFMLQRLNTNASESMSAVRIAEKVGSFSYETVMGFLDTELWDGEGYSVTVSKLIVAVLVFLSSFFLSSMGSNWIKRRMINRFKASITAANAVQRISFYILWVAFALTALNIVKIPLTAFAFLGGAFAVGLGFGMQNIFNNLISGFIVIFSRPFKVNDIIDVAGTQGTVDDIGSRSTTIKTWDGFDVILPNRYFLENSVTNWTKSDLKKREILTVGVSYDSDTREVERLLLDVAKGHSSVLKNPTPFVIFKNFGDDALEFEVYYWIELRTSSGLKVSSDMRHHIAAVFRREGINIPYPQRDIHIIESKTEPQSQD